MGILQQILEQRTHPSNPANWLLYGLSGGHVSYTGKVVTEEESLSYTAVLAGVRLLAETIASLPLHLYQRMEPRGKRRASDHQLYRTLHLRPNPEMTSMAYREAIAGQTILWGTSYSEIERSREGKIIALWPLQSSSMEMKRANGEIFYVYRLPNGGTKIFASNLILRVSGFSTNGLTGLQTVKKGQEAIGLGMALEEFGARFFGNGARPGVVLEHPAELSSKAATRLKEAFEARHQGLSGAHRIAILEEGMKLHEYGVSPEQAQALESRKFQVVEIARLFNVPPHMLKDLDRSTNNNIEFQSLEFVIYSLRPWLVRFEQAFSTQLLAEKEQSEYFIEHLVDGLLRGDTETRHKAYALGRQWGYLSANDVCELENRNPLPGDQGDIYMVPLNMVPADKIMTVLDKQANDGGDDSQKDGADPEEKSRQVREARNGALLAARDRARENYKRLWTMGIESIVNRETIAVDRAIKKYLGQRNQQGFDAWLEEFYRDLNQFIVRTLLPVMTSYSEALWQISTEGLAFEFDMEQLRAFIDGYLANYARRHTGSSIGQLRQIMREAAEEELAAALEQRASEWGETRSEREAENESRRADNAVAAFAYNVAGFGLVWQIRGAKTCPFCTALNGKRVSPGQAFLADIDFQPEGTEAPMKVVGKRLHPPLHRGCDCVVVPG